MSFEIRNVQRLRQNTESAIGVDGTGTLGNFVDTPFVEGTATAVFEQDMNDPEYAQQHKDAQALKIPGLKRCSLSIQMNAAPTGTAVGDGQTALQSPLGELLQVGMGEEHLGTGNNVASGGAVTGAVATSAAGFAQGSMVGFVRDDGIFEVRPIKTISGNTITLRLNFSEAPDTSDVLYSGATYTLAQNPTSTMQFILEGVEPQNRFLMLGMQLASIAIDIPIGFLPRFTFNYQGVNWLKGDACATDLTAQAWALASYVRTAPVHVTGNLFYQDANVVTLPAAVPTPQFNMAMGLSYIPRTSPTHSTNTIASWVRNRTKPIASGDFLVPLEDYTYLDDRTDEILHQMFFQWGVAPGKTFVLDLPAIQVTDWEHLPGNEHALQGISWESTIDANTSGTVDRSTSAFRFGML